MQGLNIKLDINIEIEEEKIIETGNRLAYIKFLGTIGGLKFEMSHAIEHWMLQYKGFITDVKNDLRYRMLSPHGIYNTISPITITIDGLGELYFKGKSVSEIIEILVKNNYITCVEVTNYDIRI